MNKTGIALAFACGLCASVVAASGAAEARNRGHAPRGFATFAYDWGPDYYYYRYRYYRNDVPTYFGRYDYDLVAAPGSCCGYTSTTFSSTYGNSAGRPAAGYYEYPNPRH